MRAFASRIIAPYAVALAGWLIGVGLPLPPEFAAVLTDLASMLLAATGMALYGVVHRVIDRRANPLDAAKVPTPGRLP